MTPSRLKRHLDKAKEGLTSSLPPGMAVIVIIAPDEVNPTAAYSTNCDPRSTLILLEGLVKAMKEKLS